MLQQELSYLASQFFSLFHCQFQPGEIARSFPLGQSFSQATRSPKRSASTIAKRSLVITAPQSTRGLSSPSRTISCPRIFPDPPRRRSLELTTRATPMGFTLIWPEPLTASLISEEPSLPWISQAPHSTSFSA